jgi:hypothetical protein
MSNFKQHIQNCVIAECNISVEIAHLEKITFKDICMLVHLISAEKFNVVLSEEVKKHLKYNLFKDTATIYMLDVPNKEELAILLYLHDNPVFSPAIYDLYFDESKYYMSDKFLIYAKKTGVDNYLLTIDICKAYGIKYKNTQLNKYFEHYISSA